MAAPEEKQDKYLYGLKPNEDTIKGHGLRTAESECQYMLPTLISKVQNNSKLKLLDVGCGPGSITLGLARYMPEGHVTGFDLSHAVLDKARENVAKQDCTNVDFVQGDVYNLPFEDKTFDVVHTHQAVCHFHEQVKAIEELLRVTKPGGVLCMREADLHTVRFWPPQPLLDECFEMIRAVHSANGGSPDAGLRLKHWTVEAGVPREKIEFTAGSFGYHTRGQTESFGMTWPGRVTEGALADQAVSMGIATRERLGDYAEAWRKWAQDEDSLFMMLHGEVIAQA